MIRIIIGMSKRTYTTGLVQFYKVTLIIDSVSCPTSGIKNQLIPFITTKTVTSNAASPPQVDIPPAGPSPAVGGAGGIGM